METALAMMRKEVLFTQLHSEKNKTQNMRIFIPDEHSYEVLMAGASMGNNVEAYVRTMSARGLWCLGFWFRRISRLDYPRIIDLHVAQIELLGERAIVPIVLYIKATRPKLPSSSQMTGIWRIYGKQANRRPKQTSKSMNFQEMISSFPPPVDWGSIPPIIEPQLSASHPTVQRHTLPPEYQNRFPLQMQRMGVQQYNFGHKQRYVASCPFGCGWKTSNKYRKKARSDLSLYQYHIQTPGACPNRTRSNAALAYAGAFANEDFVDQSTRLRTFIDVYSARKVEKAPPTTNASDLLEKELAAFFAESERVQSQMSAAKSLNGAKQKNTVEVIDLTAEAAAKEKPSSLSPQKRQREEGFFYQTNVPKKQKIERISVIAPPVICVKPKTESTDSEEALESIKFCEYKENSYVPVD